MMQRITAWLAASTPDGTQIVIDPNAPSEVYRWVVGYGQSRGILDLLTDYVNETGWSSEEVIEALETGGAVERLLAGQHIRVARDEGGASNQLFVRPAH